jgi:c-di-GMP-binding flagellar brake protein YcgR
MLNELRKSLGVNQKVQVTVWDPTDESVEYTFISQILDVEDMFFLVSPPDKQTVQILPLLQKGIVVGIVLETFPNPFIFYPVVHSRKDTNPQGYWLRILENTEIEVVQRRRHVRIPMILPLEVEYHVGDRRIPIAARTEDVSGGGMRFTAPRSFYKGQDLVLHVQLNPQLPLMHLKARVVFSAENRFRKRPEDVYATACQFYDLDDALEMMIVRECFRRELAMKRV